LYSEIEKAKAADPRFKKDSTCASGSKRTGLFLRTFPFPEGNGTFAPKYESQGPSKIYNERHPSAKNLPRSINFFIPFFN
jgi:hypothetical protein